MRVFDAAIAAAAALTATSVAAEKFHAHKVETIGDFHKAALPKEWKNAKLVKAPDNNSIAGVVDKISRRLSHWMGFNKGKGFVVATAFSDKDCLHPIWETGGNVGECMVAVDEMSGNVYGSLRISAVEHKGRLSIESNVYVGNTMCMGQSSGLEQLARVSMNCHSAGHVHVDGADTVNSYQYSWLPYSASPKIVNFGPNSFRGKLEFDTFERCGEFFSGGKNPMPNITRWTLQQVNSIRNCYPIEGAQEGEPHSFMTHCAEGHGGPGFPQNVFFRDTHCLHYMEDWEPMPQESMCMSTDTHSTSATGMHPLYNGARLWRSQFLGDMGGPTGVDICFHNGEPYFTDKLRPWNTYKDIKSMQFEDDKDGDKDEGGDSGDGGDGGNSGGGSGGNNNGNVGDYSNVNGTWFPGSGPCGCEDLVNFGVNFCSWESPGGANGAGQCLNCSNYPDASSCDVLLNDGPNGSSYAYAGYEPKLVDDCKWRCHINPGTGTAVRHCGCEEFDFGKNFCGYTGYTAQTSSWGDCVDCSGFQDPASCNSVSGYAEGQHNNARDSCRWHCFHTY